MKITHTKIVTGTNDPTKQVSKDAWNEDHTVVEDATSRTVTDAEKATWNGKQSALIADTDYLVPSTASSTYEPIKGVDDNYVSSAEKSTWNSKQDALVADTDYLVPSTAASTYEPKKGADDNYVTGAEKTVIGNTSGTNTGDQAAHYPCNGRLTLESGVSVPVTDQTDKTILYFTPHMGDSIVVYNGSAWVPFTFTELSLDISGFTASKPYDIFIYDNSGTLTLEGLVWTNTTTRATALTLQNGIYVKTGATTRRYLGTIYMDSASKCHDSLSKRFVCNYYNQVPRIIVCYNTANTWTYTTATWREYNNGTNQVRGEFITGVPECGIVSNGNGSLYFSNSSTSAAYAALAIDATDGTNLLLFLGRFSGTNLLDVCIPASMNVGIGYHYMTNCEFGRTTLTNSGTNGIVPDNVNNRVSRSVCWASISQ